MCEKLYNKALDWGLGSDILQPDEGHKPIHQIPRGESKKKKVLFDVCCGVGTVRGYKSLSKTGQKCNG